MYKSRQPHILFVLADDYGWNDIGKEYSLVLIFEIVTCICHIFHPTGSSENIFVRSGQKVLIWVLQFWSSVRTFFFSNF